MDSFKGRDKAPLDAVKTKLPRPGAPNSDVKSSFFTQTFLSYFCVYFKIWPHSVSRRGWEKYLSCVTFNSQTHQEESLEVYFALDRCRFSIIVGWASRCKCKGSHRHLRAMHAVYARLDNASNGEFFGIIVKCESPNLSTRQDKRKTRILASCHGLCSCAWIHLVFLIRKSE